MTKSVSTPARVIAPDSTTQFRHRAGNGGTPEAQAYIAACRALLAWSDEASKPLVHALVHLGWCSTKGAGAVVKMSSSKAWEHGKVVLTIGKDAPSAAEQITTVVEALREAGAPAEQVDTVWATITA